MSSRRTAFVLTVAAALAIAAMVIVTLATGATQEAHEYYVTRTAYGAELLTRPGALRLMMGLDLAFIVLYTSMFVALAMYLSARGRRFAWVAFAFIVGTAILDAVEDHCILTALEMVEHGTLPSDAWISLQQVLSASKFSLSYIGLFMFGVALPRETRLGWALSLFLTVGILGTAILAMASPPGARAMLDLGRWLSFLTGFTLLATWLKLAPDPDPT